ncbi:MAG: hypothetical protein P4L40_10635 [Terracidiphilus sp.]|nr:hypothetical protein [Terracidiphilus sp.]
MCWALFTALADGERLSLPMDGEVLEGSPYEPTLSRRAWMLMARRLVPDAVSDGQLTAAFAAGVKTKVSTLSHATLVPLGFHAFLDALLALAQVCYPLPGLPMRRFVVTRLLPLVAELKCLPRCTQWQQRFACWRGLLPYWSGVCALGKEARLAGRRSSPLTCAARCGGCGMKCAPLCVCSGVTAPQALAAVRWCGFPAAVVSPREVKEAYADLTTHCDTHGPLHECRQQAEDGSLSHSGLLALLARVCVLASHSTTVVAEAGARGVCPLQHALRVCVDGLQRWHLATTGQKLVPEDSVTVCLAPHPPPSPSSPPRPRAVPSSVGAHIAAMRYYLQQCPDPS